MVCRDNPHHASVIEIMTIRFDDCVIGAVTLILSPFKDPKKETNRDAPPHLRDA